VPDYPDAFAGWNTVASWGSYVTTIGIALFIYIVYETLTHGERAPANPWDFGSASQVGRRGNFSIEWLINSPPRFHTFNEIPQIRDVKKGAALDFIKKNPGAFVE